MRKARVKSIVIINQDSSITALERNWNSGSGAIEKHFQDVRNILVRERIIPGNTWTMKRKEVKDGEDSKSVDAKS